VACRIDDQRDGSAAVPQVKRESVNDSSTERFRLFAASEHVGHLDIDHAVECADRAFRNA
jgi:hypothetical protein